MRVSVIVSIALLGCGDIQVAPQHETDAKDDATAPVSCDDTGACVSKASCLVGTCDQDTNTCSFAPKAGTCFVDGVCAQAGQEQLGDRCKLCDPETIATAFVNRKCDGGQVCSPSTGTCEPPADPDAAGQDADPQPDVVEDVHDDVLGDVTVGDAELDGDGGPVEDAGPDAVGAPCTPFTEDTPQASGCPTGLFCMPDSQDASVGACHAPGPAPLYAACGGPNDCSAFLVCSAGFCKHLCNPADSSVAPPWGCDGTETCMGQFSGGVASAIGACDPLCDHGATPACPSGLLCKHNTITGAEFDFCERPAAGAPLDGGDACDPVDAAVQRPCNDHGTLCIATGGPDSDTALCVELCRVAAGTSFGTPSPDCESSADLCADFFGLAFGGCCGSGIGCPR